MLDDRAPGTPVVVTLVGAVSPDVPVDTLLTNTATVTTTSTDSNPDNDSATATTTVLPSADLALAKRLLDEPIAGTTVRYELAVTNNGPSTATGITVTDTIPPGTTFVPAASSSTCAAVPATVVCSIPSPLAPGTSTTVVVAVTLSAAREDGSVLSNTAAVAGTLPDTVAANNRATNLDPTTRAVDLRIAKSFPPTVGAAAPVSTTLTVTNPGPSDATDVVVTDPPIPGATWDSASVTAGLPGTCDVVAGEMTCTIFALPAGTSSEVTLLGTVAADPPGGALVNTASVTSAERELNANDNTTTESTGVIPDTGLQLSKAAEGDSAVAGGGLTYTLVAVNAGPSTAPGSPSRTPCLRNSCPRPSPLPRT